MSLLTSIVLLALLIGAALFVWQRLRQTKHPSDSSNQQVILQDGVEIPQKQQSRWDLLKQRLGLFSPTSGQARTRQSWLPQSKGATTAALILAGVVLVAITLWTLPRLFETRQESSFVVLVTPLSEMGSNQAPSSALASQLADALQGKGALTNLYRVLQSDTAPTTAQDAIALAQQKNADVVLYGETVPGGQVDQNTYQLTMVYRPTGLFAPKAWYGYDGRFAMPQTYVISASPISGATVLPQLIGALANYSAGNFDEADKALSQLLQSNAIDPALPHALRGNMYWARNEFDAAASEYRAIADYRAVTTDQPQLALFANNLGAILHDAGNGDSRDMFNTAVQLLNGQDLGELRVNLALLSLEDQQPQEAISQLDQAVNLIDPSAAVQLIRASAYRQISNFDKAQEALNAASEISPDGDIPGSLRRLANGQIDANIKFETALLTLARGLNAKGPLLWELQVEGPLPVATLQNALDDLQNVADDGKQLTKAWGELSISLDAGEQPISGIIATGQSQHATLLQRQAEIYASATQIELLRLNGIPKPSPLRNFWNSIFGDRSPLAQLQNHLQALLKLRSDDNVSQLLLARSYLISGNSDLALQNFEAVSRRLENSPEPLYGKALVSAQRSSDIGETLQLLQESINASEDFFPARITLANLAEANGNNVVAIEQRQWLAEHRKSDANSIALARTLRLSGEAGFAQAESILLPLANDKNIAALSELSTLYIDAENIPAALAVLQRAQVISPNDAQIALQLGKLFANIKNQQAAIEQFRLALRSDPSLYEAHLGLAQIYGAANPPDQAAETREYRQALESGAKDPQALEEIGRELFAQEDFDTAITAYERAIKANPTTPEPAARLQHELAQAYIKRQRWDKATSAEQTALDLRSGVYPEALVGLGDIALVQAAQDNSVAKENLAHADEYYNQALAQNPSLSAAAIGLGRVLGQQDSWGAARARFQQAITLASGTDAAQAGNTELANAYYWLGESLRHLNTEQDALDAYAKAIDIDPQNANAYIGIARIQQSQDKLDQADANLEKALKISPHSADAFLLRGMIAQQNGDLSRAIDTYSQAIDANNELTDAYFNRALLQLRQNNIDDARKDLQQVIKLDPNSAQAYYWLGRTELVRGNRANALLQFQEAIKRQSDYAEALYYQGVAEEQLGDPQAAVISVKAALEKDSTAAWVAEAQSMITRLNQEAGQLLGN